MWKILQLELSMFCILDCFEFHFEFISYSSYPFNLETPAEQVYRKLTFANMEELNETIQKEKERYE